VVRVIVTREYYIKNIEVINVHITIL